MLAHPPRVPRLIAFRLLARRRGRTVLATLALLLLVTPLLSLGGVGLPGTASAEAPRNQFFKRTWERTDQPVLAAGAGTVVYAGWNNNGYGRVIVVAHSSSFSLYGHLNSINVRCSASPKQSRSV